MEDAITATIGVEPMAENEFDGGTAAPTLDERVTTLETNAADMAEALDMILSGVTE